MDFDPLSGYIAQYALQPVRLSDQIVLNRYFKALAQPLSDYTFSQLFAWRNSLRILWKEIEGHLCVFANGTGDLTLLMPPIGDTGSDRALARCWEIMDDYNAVHGVPDRSRIEYASEELLARLSRSGLNVQPMGTDYLYDVERMIDLAGGELASKRQAKNRFLRNYKSRVEIYDKARHFDECLALLEAWKSRQDSQHAMEIAGSASALKRQKESLATRLTLEYADQLGLKGMVVYANGKDSSELAIRGFTFGETLGVDQSSIVVEKTDLEVKGLAQYIFSEFCRQSFSDRPLVNVGDDWGVQTLAWTKMSYRPVKLLQKYVLGKPAVVMAGVGAAISGEMRSSPEAEPVPAQTIAEPVIRIARKEDLASAVTLEQTCFTSYSLSKRQLQYLQARANSIFLVAEHESRVVGEAIALIRHHKRGLSGRIYSLAVSSECRGQKIGCKLMKRLLDELAARAVRRVYLEVEETNQAAMKLYGDLGFRAIAPLPDYYGEGKTGMHMVFDMPLVPTLFEAVA